MEESGNKNGSLSIRKANIQGLPGRSPRASSKLLQAKVLGDAESPPSSPDPEVDVTGLRTYPWRWVVLGLFTLNNAVTNYIWIMSAIVADLMVCYYGITETLLNFTTTSYMMVYTVFMLPTTWAMEKYGLRFTSVLASSTMALGAAVRVIGTGSQGYWLVLLGQFIASFSNLLFFGGATLLSETWFPSSERATATAIGGAMAPQIGILIAMGVTPVVMHHPLTQEVCNSSVATPLAVREIWSSAVYDRWLYYQSAVAGLAILTFLLTICAFYDAPPTPPSLSRKLETDHRKKQEEQEDRGVWHRITAYLDMLLLFFKNGYFLLFLVTSGIFLATAGAFVSIINEIVQPYFPGYDVQIGYLGVVAEAAAIVSMLIVGRILDWTKSYYIMNIILSFLGAVCVAAAIVLIQYQHHFYFLYIAVAFVGITMTAYQALAYEYAVEITYPLPEATSTGLVNVVSQVVSTVMILLVTPKRKVFAMWFVVGTTAFGALLTVFTRPKLKRVEIDKKVAGT